MNVSVVIPTCNGSAKISVLLEALLLQNETKFEVVVVDDGSIDNTVDVVKRYEQRFNSLKIISQKNGGRSVVRNRGVHEAAGDILIFYDDDMETRQDSVKRHIDFLRKHIGILGGNQVEFESSGKSDIQNYKALLTRKWTAKYTNGLNHLDRSDLFFTAANCSVRREVFEALSGFDERLTDAEDFDFAWRAMDKEIPVYFDKGNEAVHHDPITAAKYIGRLRAYQKAHARLRELYPDRQRQQRVVTGWKRKIYSLLARQRYVQWMDSEVLKKKLPRSVRYKFYELVIQALAIENASVKI